MREGGSELDVDFDKILLVHKNQSTIEVNTLFSYLSNGFVMHRHWTFGMRMPLRNYDHRRF